MDGARIRKISWFIGILISFIFIFAILFPVYQSPRDDGAYSAYDSDWDDISTLKNELEYKSRSIITTPLLLNDLESPAESILFIIGVEKAYTEFEKDVLHNYVDSGGKIIIANNNKLANDFSLLFGIRFYDEKVLDPVYIALDEHNHTIFQQNATLSGNNYTIQFNSPTGLELDKGTILCNSSYNSSLDINNNGLRDLVDKRGPIPLIALSNRNSNDGQVVFISSPSLFINQEIVKADNLQFIKDLLEYLFEMDDTPTLNQQVGITDKNQPQQIVKPKKVVEPLLIFDESRHVQPRSQQVVYNTITLLGYLSENAVFIFIILINIICLSIFWWLSIPRPKPYKHIDRLSEDNIRHFDNVDSIEFIRKVFLLKLLNSKPIEHEPSIFWVHELEKKLVSWDKKKMAQLITDPELINLISFDIKQLKELKTGDLERLRDKVIRWNYDGSK